MGYAKWILGGLGAVFGGGILGGVIGYSLGSFIDNATMSPEAKESRTKQSRDFYRQSGQARGTGNRQEFAAAMMVLSAAVMKADGKLLKSELNYIRNFFKNQFGEEVAKEQVVILQRLLKQDIPLRQVCAEIKYVLPHSARLQLMHYLFGIAKADGHVHSSETNMIRRIAGYLGISQADYESIQAMFAKDPMSAYKILEINSEATEAEIKRAYRKMAVKYHPDKVANLGEEHQEAAEAKFIKVQEAYETIKKERGIK